VDDQEVGEGVGGNGAELARERLGADHRGRADDLERREWTPERLAELASADVVIRLSAALGGRGIYPTVDPLTSRSRLLETGADPGLLLHGRDRRRQGAGGQVIVTACLDAAEAAQSRNRWRGTGSASISAGLSPTSPSSTPRRVSCSA